MGTLKCLWVQVQESHCMFKLKVLLKQHIHSIDKVLEDDNTEDRFVHLNKSQFQLVCVLKFRANRRQDNKWMLLVLCCCIWGGRITLITVFKNNELNKLNHLSARILLFFIYDSNQQLNKHIFTINIER